MAGDQTMSNPPLVKKKRNLPGTPGNELNVTIVHIYIQIYYSLALVYNL